MAIASARAGNIDAAIPAAPPSGEEKTLDEGLRPPSITRSTGVLLTATIVSNGLGIVRALAVARFMAPADYGVWSLVSTLLSYASYGDLGLNTGFILELPTEIARGRLRNADYVRRQVLSGTLFITGFVSAAVFAMSFTPWALLAGHQGSLRIVAAGVIACALVNYYQVVVRVRHNWRRVGAAMGTAAAISAAAVIVAAVLTGRLTVAAAAMATVAGSAASAIVLGYASGVTLAWPVHAPTVRRLVLLGLPVVIWPIAFTVFLNIDRWIVATTVADVDMGYYGLGSTLGGFLYMVPATLATVLFTRQIEAYGATGDPTRSESLVLPPLQVSGYVMAALGGALVIAMPFVVVHLTPAYVPALPVATLQVIGNCFLFGIPVGIQYLISVERRRIVVGSVLVAIGVEILLVAILVRTPLGIVGAAWAVAASDAIYTAVVAFLCLRLFGGTYRRHSAKVLLYFAPFAICLSIAFLLRPANMPRGSLLQDGLAVAWLETAYVALAGAICLVLSKFTGFLDEPFIAVQIKRHFSGSVAALLLSKR